MFRLILVAALVMAGGAGRIKSHDAKHEGMDTGRTIPKEAKEAGFRSSSIDAAPQEDLQSDLRRNSLLKHKATHSEAKLSKLFGLIELRSQGHDVLDKAQLYEDISWLVPCPVAGSMVKYVLEESLLAEENVGFVSATSLKEALTKATGMSSKYAIFSAGGIAAYSQTDIHQEERIQLRRAASLFFMNHSSSVLGFVGSESGLNLLTMNNDDKCTINEGATDKDKGKDLGQNKRFLGDHWLALPCNANVHHQQHGFSTNIRALEDDPKGTVEEIRLSRAKRFEEWFPKNEAILTQGKAGLELTLKGLANFMKKLQANGMKESEFSEAEREKDCDCYKNVPTTDEGGLGDAANPRMALTQWQAYLVWTGFFTYYAEPPLEPRAEIEQSWSLPWHRNETDAESWEPKKFGEGRSISETDLKNIFLDSKVRFGLQRLIVNGGTVTEGGLGRWGLLENIHVMHELGKYMGENKPDFLKLVDHHLYPKVSAKGVSEETAFKEWLGFTRGVLHMTDGTCNDAKSRGSGCE